MTWITCSDGAKIYYETQGRGTPIIFIHPPLLTSKVFDYQLKKLSKQFQIITFDLRGHGMSLVSSQPFTFSLIVNDIIELMDRLQIKQAYLCGYSAGNMIVLEALTSNHDRFLGGILISAAAKVNDWFLKTEIKTAIRLCLFRGGKLLSYQITKSNANNKQTHRQLLYYANKGDRNSWSAYYACSISCDYTEKLSTIQKPMLLIYGESDRPFHRYAQILHQQLPNNHLCWISKARHQIPTKNHLDMHSHIFNWLKIDKSI